MDTGVREGLEGERYGRTGGGEKVGKYLGDGKRSGKDWGKDLLRGRWERGGVKVVMS